MSFDLQTGGIISKEEEINLENLVRSVNQNIMDLAADLFFTFSTENDELSILTPGSNDTSFNRSSGIMFILERSTR